jgi:hypothetical protein
MVPEVVCYLNALHIYLPELIFLASQSKPLKKSPDQCQVLEILSWSNLLEDFLDPGINIIYIHIYCWNNIMPRSYGFTTFIYISYLSAFIVYRNGKHMQTHILHIYKYYYAHDEQRNARQLCATNDLRRTIVRNNALLTYISYSCIGIRRS